MQPFVLGCHNSFSFRAPSPGSLNSTFQPENHPSILPHNARPQFSSKKRLNILKVRLSSHSLHLKPSDTSSGFFFINSLIGCPQFGARQYRDYTCKYENQSKHNNNTSLHPFSSFLSRRVGHRIASCFLWPYPLHLGHTSFLTFRV
jgi:hypothetical protein